MLSNIEVNPEVGFITQSPDDPTIEELEVRRG
jgi:hypothetical protein